MKFLVLALCVCAASAASTFGNGGYKGFRGFQSAPVAPVAVAKAVESAAAAAVVPVANAAAAVVVPVAKAAAATYQAANQVVNTAYSNDGGAQILRSESDVDSNGYNYSFESSNGISGEAKGEYRPVGDAGAVVSQGAYRYTAPDGTPVFVTYIADENGYQPQSDILPVGPPTPLAILRSLEYIAAKTRETASKN